MRRVEIHSAEKLLPLVGYSSNIKWHTNIQNNVRQELSIVLNNYGINACSISPISSGREPFIDLEEQHPQIFLTQNALQNPITAIPQLGALLMANVPKLGLSRNDLQIPLGTKWEFITQLDRHLPVIDGVFAPKEQTASQLFLELIKDLDKDVKGKNGLELGTGNLILTVALSRNGVHMVGVDVSKKAIDNSFLTRTAEAPVVQDKIKIGESDLYTRLSEIAGNTNFLADILISCSPLILGDNPNNEVDRDSYAGLNFDVPRRAVSHLPRVLAPNGEAYFLFAEIESGSGLQIYSKPNNVLIEDAYWSFKHIQEVVKQFSGSWSCEQTKYRSKINSKPDIYFGIARIIAPAA